jgi:5-oxoprolinase (ATP-hydrolysing)
VAAAARCGLSRVLCFDMGGTSTDVARCDGEVPWVHEHRVGGARLLAPAVAVETVAAGGGSLCRFDGHRLLVGPESAGARPGPACYGAGGPLCLTDVNLLLGRLHPQRFEIPLWPAAAERACARLEGELAAAGLATPREELLAGLLRIADERMAEAIREISVRQGYDPRAYALLAFGGAGGQHACAVAELLGIDTVVLPPDAGLLSALGLGAARLERVVSRQVLLPLAAAGERLASWLEELMGEARAAVEAQGVPPAAVEVARAVAELRWSGQESVVEVPLVVESLGAGGGRGRARRAHHRAPAAADLGGGGAGLAAAFAARYRELYGYLPAARQPELVALRVAAAGPGALPARRLGTPAGLGAGASRAAAAEAGSGGRRGVGMVRRRAWFGRWRRVPVRERDTLAAGAMLRGPALVVEAHTTCVVTAGWEASVDRSGALLLRRRSPRRAAARPAEGAQRTGGASR